VSDPTDPASPEPPPSAPPSQAGPGWTVPAAPVTGGQAAPVPASGGDPPPWGQYGAASAVPGMVNAPQVGPPDPLRGLLAGLVAAVAGATLWALVVAVTHWEIGIAAIAVGYAVGWAVRRFGGAATTGVAVTAAVMAALAILGGFVIAQLVVGAHDAGIGIFDAVDVVTTNIGWVTFVTHSTNGLGWLFLALGAFGAFRLVAPGRRG